MAKNNSWIVWLIAVIAIAALVLAIVALGKANATGNAVFSFFKKNVNSPNAPTEEGSINPSNLDGYCTGNNSNCIGLTYSACIANVNNGCYWIPASADPSRSSFGNNFGLLGNNFLSKGGVVSNLKGYEVKYDDNGNLIYEITNGRTNVNHGANYFITELGNNKIELKSPQRIEKFNLNCGCPSGYLADCNFKSNLCTGLCVAPPSSSLYNISCSANIAS